MADQERKIYSFKSVGNTDAERRERFADRQIDQPIGFKTPLRLSAGHSGLFEMHTDVVDQIRDNFRNLISTNRGDRLLLHDFGANLLPLAFELGSESVDTEAIRRISATTSKYMPYIALETFESIPQLSDDGSLAKVKIRIVYAVPSLQAFNQVIETTIFSAG